MKRKLFGLWLLAATWQAVTAQEEEEEEAAEQADASEADPAEAPPAPPAPPAPEPPVAQRRSGRRLSLHRDNPVDEDMQQKLAKRQPEKTYFVKRANCKYATGVGDGCDKFIKATVEKWKSKNFTEIEEEIQDLSKLESESRQRRIWMEHTRDVLEIMYDEMHSEL
eukprot:TRINITY_DN84466_c0_g1_i1.p1 TRINITY_DN84466_c0_g1~~TRINITY_DN84466_c0_g1_i1.p1  ORF type:complete len:166 (+),score=50.81 TRINITY_DN84466_c0_g1_i1:52-549(+)